MNWWKFILIFLVVPGGNLPVAAESFPQLKDYSRLVDPMVGTSDIIIQVVEEFSVECRRMPTPI